MSNTVLNVGVQWQRVIPWPQLLLTSLVTLNSTTKLLFVIGHVHSAGKLRGEHLQQRDNIVHHMRG